VLAALGPRVLRLAAERTAGAHPYNTTPEHTAQAREIIGPNALLLPEHKVLPIADAEEALAVGRKVLNTYNYLNLTNYVNNFKRLGFTDADLTPPGSDNSSRPWSPTAPPTTSPRAWTSTCGPAPTMS